MVCQARVAALSAEDFRQKIAKNPNLQASRCEILRLGVSVRRVRRVDVSVRTDSQTLAAPLSGPQVTQAPRWLSDTAVANAAILCSRFASVRILGEGAEPAPDCSRGEGQAAVA